MKESEKKYLRDKLKCTHSKNGLFCEYCKFDSELFLMKYKSKFDT